jgi:hypothetical protein
MTGRRYCLVVLIALIFAVASGAQEAPPTEISEPEAPASEPRAVEPTAAPAASSASPIATAAAGGPLRVLLLDYNDPIEHDVLLSHLCVDPCTEKNDCPQAYREAGVDAFSQDFVVFRPQYLGETGQFVVDTYKDRQIDLLSFSGHHSSGFSGGHERGRFKTERLASEIGELPGWPGFFTSPSMVLLQGCWTDVKSEFDKDPVEYIRHVIQDTEVRPGESDRLVAAINQVAAGKQAYRELFPNACLLGYRGSQAPGGLLEIYGQVHGSLRGVAQRSGQAVGGWKIPLPGAIRADFERLIDVVDRECAGWPCNLCRRDPETYRPLARGLATFLRAERKRLGEGKARPAPEAQGIERALEDAGYYRNASWSCPATPTDTPPELPPPIDRTPFAELFLDLLMTSKLGNVEPSVRQSLDAELVLLLGDLALSDEQREKLRLRLESEPTSTWLRAFVPGTLPGISSSRQRAFFDFLAATGCAACFAAIPDEPGAWILRENAASRLRPELGRDLLQRFLADAVPRVRREAIQHLDPKRDRDLLQAARADQDEQVRAWAEKMLAASAASP